MAYVSPCMWLTTGVLSAQSGQRALGMHCLPALKVLFFSVLV